MRKTTTATGRQVIYSRGNIDTKRRNVELPKTRLVFDDSDNGATLHIPTIAINGAPIYADKKLARKIRRERQWFKARQFARIVWRKVSLTWKRRDLFAKRIACAWREFVRDIRSI